MLTFSLCSHTAAQVSSLTNTKLLFQFRLHILLLWEKGKPLFLNSPSWCLHYLILVWLGMCLRLNQSLRLGIWQSLVGLALRTNRALAAGSYSKPILRMGRVFFPKGNLGLCYRRRKNRCWTSNNGCVLNTGHGQRHYVVLGQGRGVFREKSKGTKSSYYCIKYLLWRFFSFS